MSDDIILRKEGCIGRVTLNRPQALNAFTLHMGARLLDTLWEWKSDPDIRAVIIDAVPGRAFCAGADVRALAEWGKRSDPRAMAFFITEYRLNAAIAEFGKPYIALIDGMVMGGGAGLSIHGSHRLVSENALFAMPETVIGFIPDIGASYFMPRLPGAIGMYLALTGARLNDADMVYAGLATHCLPAPEFPECIAKLVRGISIEEICASIPNAPHCAPLFVHRAAIDRVFALNSVEEILLALKEKGNWGEKTARSIAAGSPTSVKLTFRALRQGASCDLKTCLRMEYRIVARLLEGHDYYEGVRARLIDKDSHPHWRPSRLEEVSDADIASHFLPLEDGELTLQAAQNGTSSACFR